MRIYSLDFFFPSAHTQIENKSPQKMRRVVATKASPKNRPTIQLLRSSGRFDSLTSSEKIAAPRPPQLKDFVLHAAAAAAAAASNDEGTKRYRYGDASASNEIVSAAVALKFLDTKHPVTIPMFQANPLLSSSQQRLPNYRDVRFPVANPVCVGATTQVPLGPHHFRWQMMNSTSYYM